MKISKLLATRQHILRQAHLGNLAHAYVTLKRLAERADTANLRGLVKLEPSDPQQERFWPSLIALEGSQSVIEEQFSDEDILELADAVVLAIESDYTEIEFRLEEMAEKFVLPLRAALDHAGVVVDLDQEEPNLAAGNND